MPTGEMSCDNCHKPINVEFGYVEINITVWQDWKFGDSEKQIFHKSCTREKTKE